MIAAEAMMDDIARKVGRDPLDVRLDNLYAPGRDETPYGQKIEQHMLHEMMEKLASDADYRERRIAISRRRAARLAKIVMVTPMIEVKATMAATMSKTCSIFVTKLQILENATPGITAVSGSRAN